MSIGYIRCQYIDPISKQECETWYPHEDEEIYCPLHRAKEVVHIPKTVTVIPEGEITELNGFMAEANELTIPQIAEHIKELEARIKLIERERRGYSIVKRNKEDALTDEERNELRLQSSGYNVTPHLSKSKKKSPEEKAKSRKEGW